MRLIDADAYEYPGDLVHMPTIDAEPVRHGRWMTVIYDMKIYDAKAVPFDLREHNDAYCSECLAPALCNGQEEAVPSRYCPNCGAKMDGGAEHEDNTWQYV